MLKNYQPEKPEHTTNAYKKLAIGIAPLWLAEMATVTKKGKARVIPNLTLFPL
jgi:hypothetical protein